MAVKEFFQPESPREVVELLTKYGDRALLLAGGTFLQGLFARGLASGVDAFVDLQRAGLSGVSSVNGSLVVGAMTTFTELDTAGPITNPPEFGAVRDALHYPPAQIRNMATVGGCIASACPLFDLPVALMALDGAVRVFGAGGTRIIALDRFFVDYFEHALGANEFLTEVLLPKLRSGTASAFLKLETNANDLALLNVGVRVVLDEAGICREARVVFGGGVGSVPVRAARCEALLTGKRLDLKLLRESAEAVSDDLHPISDSRASAQYRVAVAKVFVRRALNRAITRLGYELS